jgi:hypothetical protein
MAGMLFILFLLVSICLLIFVVWLVARLARQRGRRGWLYGMTVFLAVLGLLFWDWLPMEISYRNKCENEAGLTVYKTLEEWKIENPRVWETLTPTPYWRGLLFSKKNETNSWVRYQRNERFAEDTQKIQHWFTIVETRKSIVDLQTGATIIAYIDFSTNYRFFMFDLKLRNFRFWMEKTGCRWADAFDKFQPHAVTQRLYREAEYYETLEKTFTGSKHK